jgi:holliday junction DNA helicase RuvB
MILKEFGCYVGNNHIKRQLSISILAAKKSNTAPPHMLFVGHHGCGKTKMSYLVSEIVGAKLIQASPESFKSAQEVRDLLAELPQNGYDDFGRIVGQIKPGVIFLDEIHNLPLKGQEAFGIAMEYFRISTQLIRFRRVRRITEWVPKFTLIGATTETGSLSKPFIEKFKLTSQFELYSERELMVIAFNYLNKKGVYINEEAAKEIAIRSRGTPRLVVRYCDRMEEMSTIYGIRKVDKAVTDKVFDVLGIDTVGLTPLDRKILLYLFGAERPIGVDNLSVITAESRKTLESTVEPFLLRQGLIIRSSGGRLITERGEKYLIENNLVDIKTKNRIIDEEI